MFVEIEDNYLKMNRGDTYELPLTINEGTKLNFIQYEMRRLDKIYVGIMEPNQAWEDALIRKVLTINSPIDEYGRPILVLDSKDTEFVLIGKYFIEIKLVQNNNGNPRVTTILPLREFWINGTNKVPVDEESIVYEDSKPLYKDVNTSEWDEISAPTSPEVPMMTDMEWSRI